jgi:hypothetical protein
VRDYLVAAVAARRTHAVNVSGRLDFDLIYVKAQMEEGVMLQAWVWA